MPVDAVGPQSLGGAVIGAGRYGGNLARILSLTSEAFRGARSWDVMNAVTRVAVVDRGEDLVAQDALDLESRTQSAVAHRTGDMHFVALTGKEALAAVVDEFVAAIREGRTPPADHGLAAISSPGVLNGGGPLLTRRRSS